MRFAPIILAVLLGGCAQFRGTPKAGGTATATPVDARSGLVVANRKADAASGEVDQATTELHSKLLANIDTARARNEDNPDGPPKTEVDGELAVAQGRLQGVTADPVELAAAAERRALLEQGKSEEARAAYARAVDDAKTQADALATAKANEAQALKERDAARASEEAAYRKFTADVEANRAKNQAIMDKLVADQQAELDRVKDEEQKKFNRTVTYILLGAGVIFIAVGAFSAYGHIQTGSPVKAAIGGSVWGGAAAFCFTCAWTINQPWFKWVVIVGGSLGIAGTIVFVAMQLREAKDKKNLKVRSFEADEAEDTLKRVMGVIDALPAGNEIFGKLSGAMNDNHKALVKELGAEAKRSTTPTPA